MSLHGFINVTTTANQSAIINIDCITTIVANVTDRNCKISTINGDVYPVFLSTCEVEDLIKKAQEQSDLQLEQYGGYQPTIKGDVKTNKLPKSR